MARMDYKQTMQSLMADLSDLLLEKETLEERLQEVIERIAMVREAAWSMKALSGIDPDKEYPQLFHPDNTPDVGFTDAIREVFRASLGIVLTPVGVRNALKDRGFKLESYKNPLASIHTILKRLEKQGELVGLHDDEDNPTGYAMLPKTGAEIDAVISKAVGKDVPSKTDLIVANPPYAETKTELSTKPRKQMIDVVREVLESSGEPMSVMQIVDQLIKKGVFKRGGGSATRAHVELAAQRLHETEGVIKGRDKSRRATFRWMTEEDKKKWGEAISKLKR